MATLSDKLWKTIQTKWQHSPVQFYFDKVELDFTRIPEGQNAWIWASPWTEVN